MNPVENFITYLAQAHGCSLVQPIKSHAAPLLSDIEREPCLVAVRISAAGHGLALGPQLGTMATAMEFATVGILIIEASAGREDVLPRLGTTFRQLGLTVAFLGAAPAGGKELVAVLHGQPTGFPPLDPAPASFRVLAIVPAYNEGDIIAQTVRDLAHQEIDVYLLDNWSTDQTIELAQAACPSRLMRAERFPPDGPSATYELSRIMARVEEIALEQTWATWVVLHDADERRRSPWPGISLRDALWHVDRSGFNCVDHVTMNFSPVDDTFDPGGPDIEQQLLHFEFSAHPGHFHQRRAWKQLGCRVALAPSAGHDCSFPGRCVYPYKFLLKHYPIRSQRQGERKVLCERVSRWNGEERARGWHRQYDEMQPGTFLKAPARLTRFDPQSFYKDYLVQRLSAAGIFDAPPSWATSPKW